MLTVVLRQVLYLASITLATLVFSVCLAWGQHSDEEVLRHYEAAHQAQNAGSLSVAAQEYSKVIQMRPQTAEAYASLGLVYNAQGKFAESVRMLVRADQLKHGLPGVSLYLGMGYAKLGQPELAIPYLKEAGRQEPTNKQAHIWLGTALWDAGHTPAALLQLRKTSLAFPSDPDVLLIVGEAYRKAAAQGIGRLTSGASGTPLLHQIYGDIYKDKEAWQKASGHYHRAIELDTRWHGAHFGLGEVALQQGKLEDAALEFHRELNVNPVSAAAQARLAEIALLRQNVEEALALFSAAIRVAPEQAASALGLPPSYASANEHFSEQAQEQFRQSLSALERTPASPSRSLALATAQARLGNEEAFLANWKDFQSAVHRAPTISSFTSALANFDDQDFNAAETDLYAWLLLHPKDMEAQYLLARTYRNLSLRVLDRLLTVAADSYPAHQLLAETYEEAEDEEKALAEYRTVERMAPNLPGVHLSIGEVLIKTGRFDQAIVELESELRLDPDNAEANAQIGTLLIARPDQQTAVDYLEKAIRIKPNLAAAHRELGKAYFLRKDYVHSATELEKAVKNDPEGSAHYQLGLVYRALGRSDAASQQFTLARKIKADLLSKAEATFAQPEPLQQ